VTERAPSVPARRPGTALPPPIPADGLFGVRPRCPGTVPGPAPGRGASARMIRSSIERLFETMSMHDRTFSPLVEGRPSSRPRAPRGRAGRPARARERGPHAPAVPSGRRVLGSCRRLSLSAAASPRSPSRALQTSSPPRTRRPLPALPPGSCALTSHARNAPQLRADPDPDASGAPAGRISALLHDTRQPHQRPPMKSSPPAQNRLKFQGNPLGRAPSKPPPLDAPSSPLVAWHGL
jgi:hypothetical protein